MPTFIRNVRRVTRSCSRRCSCSSGLGGGSFSSIRSLLRSRAGQGFLSAFGSAVASAALRPAFPARALHSGYGCPGVAGLCAISHALTLVISSSVIARPGMWLRQSGSPISGLPAMIVVRTVCSLISARNDPSRIDPALPGCCAFSPWQRAHAAAYTACPLLHRPDERPCRAAESVRRSGFVLFPSRPHALHDRVDLRIGQRPPALHAETGHQRALLAIRNHIAQRCIVDQRLVFGIGEIRGRSIVPILAVAARAVLPIQGVE